MAIFVVYNRLWEASWVWWMQKENAQAGSPAPSLDDIHLTFEFNIRFEWICVSGNFVVKLACKAPFRQLECLSGPALKIPAISWWTYSLQHTESHSLNHCTVEGCKSCIFSGWPKLPRKTSNPISTSPSYFTTCFTALSSIFPAFFHLPRIPPTSIENVVRNNCPNLLATRWLLSKYQHCTPEVRVWRQSRLIFFHERTGEAGQQIHMWFQIHLLKS